MVAEGHHQHFQNQEKTGNVRKLIKKRKGRKLESVRIKIIYGDPKEVKDKLGCHTAYIERTNLTSRTMNFTFRLKIGKQGLASCRERPWSSKVRKKEQ